jgi:hypothetical protein
VSHSPPPAWPALLRAQGRTMTWLAQQTGASRTYLADVAAGRKQASPELEQRIKLALADRLDRARDYAAWRQVEQQADALAAAIRAALGNDPR